VASIEELPPLPAIRLRNEHGRYPEPRRAGRPLALPGRAPRCRGLRPRITYKDGRNQGMVFKASLFANYANWFAKLLASYESGELPEPPPR